MLFLPDPITLQPRLISLRLQKRISSVLKPFSCFEKGSIKCRWGFYHFCVHLKCIKLLFDSDSVLEFSYGPKSPATFLSRLPGLKYLKTQ